MHAKEGELRREIGALALACVALDVGEQGLARRKKVHRHIFDVVRSWHHASLTVEIDGFGGAA